MTVAFVSKRKEDEAERAISWSTGNPVKRSYDSKAFKWQYFLFKQKVRESDY